MGLRDLFRWDAPPIEAAAVGSTLPARPAGRDGASANGSAPVAAGPPSPGMNVQVTVEPTRDEAMQVAAVVRARNILCGTIGGLPLRTWRTMAGLWDEVPGPSWTTQPDPSYTRIWTIAQTVDDLIFSGRAYWHVRCALRDGLPDAVEYLTLPRVSYNRTHGATFDRYGQAPELGSTWEFRVDGRAVPPNDIVRFDGIAGEGVLKWGAHEIRTAPRSPTRRGASRRSTCRPASSAISVPA